MVTEIIRSFKVNSMYKGYNLIIEAVEIYSKNELKRVIFMKDIYEYLSEKYDIPSICIERNIRTVIQTCWNNDSAKVNEIVGYDCVIRPSNGVFIEALSRIRQNESAKK